MRKTLFVFCLLVFLAAAPFSQEKDFPVLKGPYLGQKPPGDVPVVFAPGIVTLLSEMNHNPPVFSPDGTEIYWSELSGDPYYSKIKYSRMINDIWTTPVFVPFAYQIDGAPILSTDGEKLYFVSWRPLQGEKPQSESKLWFVKRNGEKWSAPKILIPVVNTEQVRWQFSVAENSNLYFDSERGLMLSRFLNGEYQKPEKVSDVLHSAYDGITPYIAPDEGYIIFGSSELPGCLGETDLYIGFRKADGSWSIPIHLGRKINSSDQDLCLIVTPDKKYLFFISRRSGEYHVYWVSANFIEELLPKNLTEVTFQWDIRSGHSCHI